MTEYSFLPKDHTLSKEEVTCKYNQLIEDIWHYQYLIKKLSQDYDLLLESYEEVADKLYG